MTNLKSVIAAFCALSLVHCSDRKQQSEREAEPMMPQATACTPELASQRREAINEIYKGPAFAQQAASACERFEAVVPEGLPGCTLEDGTLVSLEDDLKRCEEAKQAAQTSSPKEEPAKQEPAKQEPAQQQPAGQQPAQTQPKQEEEEHSKSEAREPEAVPAKPESPLIGDNSVKDIGDGRQVYAPRVNKAGVAATPVDAKGEITVSFEDPVARTSSSERFPVAELVPQLLSPKLKICEQTYPLNNQAEFTDKSGQVYRFVAAFQNGKIAVEPQIRSNNWISFVDGYPLEPAAHRVIDASTVSGVPVRCAAEFCQGDKIHNTKEPKRRDDTVSRVFCDGTIVVNEISYFGVGTERIVTNPETMYTKVK